MAIFILNQHHDHIDIARNGKDALELMKKCHYDLVYMDVGLPDMEGYEVTEAMRKWETIQDRSTTIIVALTAHVEDYIRDRCMDSGMQYVLHKMEYD